MASITHDLFLIGVAILALIPTCGAVAAERPQWPAEIQHIQYSTWADETKQPALWYDPKAKEPAPLLVGLHSWSSDYTYHECIPYGQWAVDHGWVFIQPNYRGPNNKPEACMSELAVLDILSAVRHARTSAKVDPMRIYLIGGSGGGHAAMQMAGRAPELWAGVSAWIGISDLRRWYVHCQEQGYKYAGDVAACVGGDPTRNEYARAEAALRSPLTWLHRARGVKMDINHGIHDGTCPNEHSLRAYNVLADPADRLNEKEIGYFNENKKVPPHLASEKVADPLYGDKRVLFRRESGNVRLTLFDAAHRMVPEAGLQWLSRQRRAKKNGCRSRTKAFENHESHESHE